MGFSTAQGSSVHTQCVFKIENFVSCDMSLWSMEEALEQTAQITSRQSLIIFGSGKIPLATELTIKRKFSYNPVLIGQNV